MRLKTSTCQLDLIENIPAIDLDIRDPIFTLAHFSFEFQINFQKKKRRNPMSSVFNRSLSFFVFFKPRLRLLEFLGRKAFSKQTISLKHKEKTVISESTQNPQKHNPGLEINEIQNINNIT